MKHDLKEGRIMHTVCTVALKNAKYLLCVLRRDVYSRRMVLLEPPSSAALAEQLQHPTWDQIASQLMPTCVCRKSAT